ncbi:MAG TPA: hypothetical protein VGM44_21330 [Polyangiaceae bacterium]|jgi:hypothetical protein
MRNWNFEGSLPRVGVVLALGVLAAGCTATSQYMHAPSAPVPTIAPPNAAVVVFLRPSHYGEGVLTTILDDRGAFMGDSIGGTEFSVILPPGPHVFLSWAENTAPLQATLLPGRVYYVEVSPRMGFWSTRVQLLAITPRSESWKEVDEWMRECSQLVPDAAAGQAYLNGRAAGVAERIRRARERLGGLEADERNERTLNPEDGVQSQAPVLVATSASVPPAPSVPSSK